jgi:hypothetical protein
VRRPSRMLADMHRCHAGRHLLKVRRMQHVTAQLHASGAPTTAAPGGPASLQLQAERLVMMVAGQEVSPYRPA